MNASRYAKIIFGVLLFIASLLLILWFFQFFVVGLSLSTINYFGVLVVLGVLLFGIFYLFSIATHLLGSD